MRKRDMSDGTVAEFAKLAPQDLIICINALALELTRLRQEDRCYRAGGTAAQAREFACKCANYTGQIWMLESIMSGLRDGLDDSSHQLELWEQERNTVDAG